MTAPVDYEEATVLLRRNVNGNVEMADTSLVLVRGVVGRRAASPALSLVHRPPATGVSSESRIPYKKRSSRDRRLVWRGPPSTIQLIEAPSGVVGQTGQAIVRGVVAGLREPQRLTRHRLRMVNASEAEVGRTQQGNWREVHLFVLGQSWAMYGDMTRHLAACGAQLGALLVACSRTPVDIGRLPRAGSKARLADDIQWLANWASVGLMRIKQRRQRSVASLSQASRRSSGLSDQPAGDSRMRRAVFSSIPCEPDEVAGTIEGRQAMHPLSLAGECPLGCTARFGPC